MQRRTPLASHEKTLELSLSLCARPSQRRSNTRRFPFAVFRCHKINTILLTGWIKFEPTDIARWHDGLAKEPDHPHVQMPMQRANLGLIQTRPPSVNRRR